jgi:uncharacterized protein YajQ (UPF0234 family)
MEILGVGDGARRRFEAGRVRVCSPWKDELPEAIGMRREQDFGVAKRFRNQAGNHQH